MLRPGTGGTPEPAVRAVAEGTKEASGLDRAPDGTPLYVHLPFCAAKCHYCDFFSVPAEGQDRDGMIGAILAEAERFAPRNPQTVYFGGGTPSLLDAGELERLLDALDRITSFRSIASEVTAECNPESLDEEKARALLRLGVTRLSIGIQSLHDDVLASFGRVHSADDGLRAYGAARQAGASDVNVDLIYAVPGQTAASWSRDLDRILALEPDHVSAYNLTFEEETPFRRWLDEGKLARSSEETELELFWIAREMLAARGYDAYEISNFARPGRRCRHNVNYWRNGGYLGLGPSAVSKVGHSRAGNLKGTGAYVRRIAEGGDARIWKETPSAATRLAETWWLGLRLREGLRPSDARRAAGLVGDHDPALGVAEALEGDGLLERSDERFRLTHRGLPLADWIARRFLERAGEG
jgi:putative oxygen-independent coproporphyrinogen III oxidase